LVSSKILYFAIKKAFSFKGYLLKMNYKEIQYLKIGKKFQSKLKKKQAREKK
jgi:hypothetical protein